MNMMPHDTRRGSSQYRSTEGYAEADAHEDRHERERALAVVRARANRERDRSSGVPSAHALNGYLADAVALICDPVTGDRAAGRAIARALRRVLHARGVDVTNPAIQRRIEVRLRRSDAIVEREMTAQVARTVEAEMQERRQRVVDAGVQSLMDLYAELPDDDVRE